MLLYTFSGTTVHPPPSVIEPAPELEAEIVEMLDRSVTEDDVIFAEVAEIIERKEIPPPPPVHAPSPAPEPDNLPLIFAERMPVFGEDCKQLSGEKRKQCSERALLTFVQQGVKYPAMARNNGIQGVVVVKFVVERDGAVSGIEAIRTLGGGCTEAAVKALERINTTGLRFTPGIQGDNPMRVAFNLPVKFALE